jgi:hypothetical protein
MAKKAVKKLKLLIEGNKQAAVNFFLKTLSGFAVITLIVLIFVKVWQY